MSQRREVIKKIDTTDQIWPALAWVQQMTEKALAGGPVQITLGRERRSLDQNALLWPLLSDLSKQIEWYGEHMAPEDWKHVMTAGLKKQRAVPGIDGGFVVLGQSTRQMKKAEFSDLIELIFSFGSERGVKWSDKSDQNFYELRNVA